MLLAKRQQNAGVSLDQWHFAGPCNNLYAIQETRS